jgi:hypothetical protein
MESHTLELHPEIGQAHLALFTQVTNAEQLRQRLLKQDATLVCALVDATLVRMINETEGQAFYEQFLCMYSIRYSIDYMPYLLSIVLSIACRLLSSRHTMSTLKS